MLGRMKDRMRRARSHDESGSNHHYLESTVLDYNSKTSDLASFDACVETCDAQAASSLYAKSAVKRDKATGMKDCSVLVSADGDLLLVPQDTAVEKEAGVTTATDSDNNSDSPPSPMAKLRMGLPKTDAFAACVIMGNDLVPNGDLSFNGFSALGWSGTATSLALRQTEASLRDMNGFVDELLRNKKEGAVRTMRASDKFLMSMTPAANGGGSIPPMPLPNSMRGKRISASNSLNSLSDLEPLGSSSWKSGRESLELVPSRVGPLRYSGGTLYAATIALEQYHSVLAENDDNRWRKATKGGGVLASLKHAADKAAERAYHRELSLKDMQRRANDIEERLLMCKKESKQRWQAVHEAEELVTRIVEERMMIRNRERERQRLEQFRAEQAVSEQNKTELGATSGEIWDIVSSVTADGSFAPLDLPQAPVQGPRDVTTASSTEESREEATRSPSPVLVESVPVASRHEIEYECNLPALRQAALSADDAIEDASASLLNILSNLDTTRRSARLAAETCLLSACNAQKACIEAMVKMEREAIADRLQNIEDLERIASNIDTRSDLDAYISQDKKERGGSTWLGDDDDGGVASALAVLSSHVEGNIGTGSPTNRVNTEGWSEKEGENITSEKLEDAVEDLFLEDVDKDALEEYEKNVAFLCKVAEDQKNPSSRSRRSTICYALNAKRTSAELKNKVQFDGIARVLSSILTGCDRDPGGVSNSKMSMMLAQTFYVNDEDQVAAASETSLSPNRAARDKRIFVKGRLIDHPLWLDEEFWDQTLFQCVTESLTHSGVMANFEQKGSGRENLSEWTETRKLKWHDLGHAERCEAAAQVHAVVFAQLGALAHSMMEFGCGLERSCAFVRRMAVRNQLPLSQRTMLLQHLMGRKESDNNKVQIESPASKA